MSFFKPRGKYGAQKTSLGFPSKLEEAVYFILLEKEKLGLISEIKRQSTVRLSEAKIGYRPDFRFTDNNTGEYVWVEAKGFPTAEWKLKKKLWKFYGPGLLIIYQGTHRNPKKTEEVCPIRMQKISHGYTHQKQEKK